MHVNLPIIKIMKKIITFLVLLVPFLSFAQEGKEVAVVEKQDELSNIKHPIVPLLWKIEKEGLKKPAYLFGTVHLSDPRVLKLHPTAQKAFESAHRVYTEVDMSSKGMMKELELSLRPEGSSLMDSIGPELTQRLDDELKAISKTLSIHFFDRLKTIVVAVSLSQLESQLSGAMPLDIQLWNRASDASKTVKALEDSEERMAHLDKLSEKEQKALLVAALLYMEKGRLEKVDPNKPILEAYLRGDEKVMLDFSKFKAEEWGGADKRPLHDKFFKILLDDRNKDMLETIDKELTLHPNKIHFFAAGAMHYIGKNSVVEMLEKEGYKVTRIKK